MGLLSGQSLIYPDMRRPARSRTLPGGLSPHGRWQLNGPTSQPVQLTGLQAKPGRQSLLEVHVPH